MFIILCSIFLFSAPIQDIKNRIVGGPVPTLTITNSRIKSNKQGVRASFYNRLVSLSFSNMMDKTAGLTVTSLIFSLTWLAIEFHLLSMRKTFYNFCYND
jgi:hypothetical protein